MRVRALLCLLLLLSTVLPGSRAAAGTRFPLRPDTGGRRLVDARGSYFFYQADTAWMLFLGLTLEEASEYLVARKTQGFTAIQVQLTGFLGARNRAGELPFGGDHDFSAPNEKYFQHVDLVLERAEDLGLLLAVAPLWAGCCSEGWAGRDKNGAPKPMDRNGPVQCRELGRWLSKRYSRFQNVLWILGGDNDPQGSREAMRELALGLKETAPHHLLTYHAASSHSSTDVWPGEAWMDVSMIYTYFRGFDKAWNKQQPDVYEAAYAERKKSPARPFFLGESTYEGEHGDWGSALQVRKQAYWAMLSGAVGHAYGSPAWKCEPGWREALELPGAKSLVHLRRLLESRPWHLLVPDEENRLAVGGRGPFARNDYATSALSSDGSFGLAYLPSPRKLTVDLERLSGTRLSAWWYDPRSGRVTAIGELERRGHRMFEPPGPGDWVLVLDDASRGFSPPGAGAPPATGRAPSYPWPDELEREYQERARHILTEQLGVRVAAGNTYFENEKRTYGYLIAQAVGGSAEALKQLQIEDAQANEWHRETQGIDFYACFTLKHQTRKYFLLGDLLEPDYRQRMLEGGKAWTAQDPLGRPHPAFQGPGPGWGPDRKNSWVDVRTTENLFLMRVTSVYLFAEAAGNREVEAKYREQIRTHAVSLYRVGMGEWDSENYHGHSIAPLLNLHDFARDGGVKALARASLDWIFASGAVKYWRGGFNGPSKRDYNHVQPFGGSAAAMLWVHFGDSPLPNRRWESDEVHVLTSGYRPPEAIVWLARKRFPRPVELFASKPHYDASRVGDLESPPEYLETQYFGRTFQLGTLATGTSADNGDVNGFKALVWSEKRGAGTIQCAPGPDPEFVGSPKYTKGKVSARNRIAQYGPAAIWLVEDGASPWAWLLPGEIAVEAAGSNGRTVTFLRGDRTWLAIHPIGITPVAVEHPSLHAWPDHQALSSRGSGGAYCGFALEIGEAGDDSGSDYRSFQALVLERSRVDLARLRDGVVEFQSATGRRLRLEYSPGAALPRVERDGRPHDWAEHARAVYRGESSVNPAPIEQAWLGGKLTVRAGGKTFACEVSEQGDVIYSND